MNGLKKVGPMFQDTIVRDGRYIAEGQRREIVQGHSMRLNMTKLADRMKP